MPMPYGANLTSGSNSGRDRITQALLNVQNPPPQMQMPQPPPMQGMPPPGGTPSQMAASAMPPPPAQPPMGGLMGAPGNMQPGGVTPPGVAPPAPQLGQLPPQVQQQLQPPQQLPVGGPTGY